MKTILGVVLGMAIALGATAAQSEVRICLDAARQGNAFGLPNYAYSGRIMGEEAGDAYGYWTIAIDEGGAYWPQIGGQVQAANAKAGAAIRFGVSNVSAYPLAFVVARMSKADYAWLRVRSLDGRALSDEEKLRTPLASREGDCVVGLDDKEAPAVKACSCVTRR